MTASTLMRRSILLGGMDRASLEHSDEDETWTGNPKFLSNLIYLNLGTHFS